MLAETYASPDLPPQVNAALVACLPKVMSQIYHSQSTNAVQEAMFHVFDTNKDGVMSKAEYDVLWDIFLPTDPANKLDALFNIVDIDNDGMVDRLEATAFMQALLSVAIATIHMCVDMYGFMVEEMMVSMGTAVIEHLSLQDGITLEQVMNLVAQGPEKILSLTEPCDT
jgi:hypothetical protein